MRDVPEFEVLRLDAFRRPHWRWERAQYLVDYGMYVSRKRDDTATGIAVKYLREVARCSIEGRKRRIRSRFDHVDRARHVFEEANEQRLEIETRMLARQPDTAIAYHLDLPPETVQAYRDLFFHIEDRIDATGYIVQQVIGYRSNSSANAKSLMQLSAYFHGPEVIGAWMTYIREGWNGIDLDTERNRLMATIDITVSLHQLPDSPEIRRTLSRNASILFASDSEPRKSLSVATAFSNLCSQIDADLPFPAAKLPPFSYSAASESPRPARETPKSVKSGGLRNVTTPARVPSILQGVAQENELGKTT